MGKKISTKKIFIAISVSIKARKILVNHLVLFCKELERQQIKENIVQEKGEQSVLKSYRNRG